MWINALTVVAADQGPLDTGSGSSTALIITAVCGGIAAIMTALSLLLKSRGDRTEPSAPGPDGPVSSGDSIPTQVAVLRREIEILRGDMIERVAAVRADLEGVREELWERTSVPESR